MKNFLERLVYFLMLLDSVLGGGSHHMIEPDTEREMITNYLNEFGE